MAYSKSLEEYSFLKIVNVSRPLFVVSCDNIFNHLGEMPDSCIIFCYIQELLEFYLLDNKQLTTINGLYLIILKRKNYLQL